MLFYYRKLGLFIPAPLHDYFVRFQARYFQEIHSSLQAAYLLSLSIVYFVLSNHFAVYSVEHSGCGLLNPV